MDNKVEYRLQGQIDSKKEVFDLKEKDIEELGRAAPKLSFIAKILPIKTSPVA